MKKTAQRVPASKNLTMDMALKRKGYYDKTNNWNSLLTLDEYPEKVFRDRVEVLIFKGKTNNFNPHTLLKNTPLFHKFI